MKDQAEELELGADQRIRRKSKISKSNLKPQKVSINIPALNIPNPASPASFPGNGPTGCRYPFRRTGLSESATGSFSGYFNLCCLFTIFK